MTNYRAALTDTNGFVTSVIVLDDDFPWEPPAGITVHPLTDEPVGPGWRRDGDTWVAPPEPEPEPDPGPTLEDRLAEQQALTDEMLLAQLDLADHHDADLAAAQALTDELLLEQLNTAATLADQQAMIDELLLITL